MSSDWNRQWVDADGNLNASYYVVDVDYANAYSLYNQDPVGDKQGLATAVYRRKGAFSAYVDGRYLCDVPITWTRLAARIPENQGIWAKGALKWRTNGDHQHFLFKISITDA